MARGWHHTEEAKRNISLHHKDRGNFKQFCRHGHDTSVVGRTSVGQCKECYNWIRREANWRKYGILNQDGELFNTEDFNREFQIQGGRCLICKRHQSDVKKAFSVDHDHKTQKFSGILCSTCNTAIGMLQEDVEVLKVAIEYLSLRKVQVNQSSNGGSSC